MPSSLFITVSWIHGKIRETDAPKTTWRARNSQHFSWNTYLPFILHTPNSRSAHHFNQLEGAFGWWGKPSVHNTPWLTQEMAEMSFLRINPRVGSLASAPSSHPAAPGAPRLPCRHRRHRRRCSPKRGHFNILISRTVFTTCSCGAKEAPRSAHTEPFVGKTELGGFLSNMSKLTQLQEAAWGGDRESYLFFFIPISLFGVFITFGISGLINSNSLWSTVRCERAGIHFSGLQASKEQELELINKKRIPLLHIILNGRIL